MSQQASRTEIIEWAKYLTVHFEGYFTCRLSTDPDPTNEGRGMSGYTMALVKEENLDRVIRLQVNEEFINKNIRTRPPAEEMGFVELLQQGVSVKQVTFDGQPLPNHPLCGAKVNLLGKDEPANGPTFESRNNITGSDDNFSFAIEPFELEICNDQIKITAQDYLDPADVGKPPQESKPIWKILDPAIYGRRLPVSFEIGSQEVARALNVFDLYGYFYDRRRFLQKQIDLLKQKNSLDADEQVQLEQFKSRLYQLEFWGDRIISKLGTKVDWSFEINGNKTVSDNLGGKANLELPWPVKFWFGGWDGDFLIGYMRGSLSIPFEKDS
ncbi:hypothetical protein [Anabaena azotica]|uniref:Uncharacterized protein n=1 Tax=Anabaena azotica FACHB-119 TaxID=947527 RepID=A0ABR8D4J3_9NOST|nr:hypothetical protein [Anabaena azotica]MBD2502105.1 hypothetical protein [Anabaena azotica FACHB-119]